MPLVTCVLWGVSLCVGVAGLWWSYPTGQAMPVASALQTRIVTVQMQEEAPLPRPPVPEEAPKIGGSQTLSVPVPLPPTMQPVALPAAPPTAVALPKPLIAFTLPTQGLIKVVDTKSADYRTVTAVENETPNAKTLASGAPVERTPIAAPIPAVTHLTFGEGEGNQPPPEYPRAAQLAGEEGSVGMQFTVDADGKVNSVKMITPSRWPLLNTAATRSVRAHWRFQPGSARTYDVTIQFQLQQ